MCQPSLQSPSASHRRPSATKKEDALASFRRDHVDQKYDVESDGSSTPPSSTDSDDACTPQSSSYSGQKELESFTCSRLRHTTARQQTGELEQFAPPTRYVRKRVTQK
eukprot:3937996-Rhodomonas_salina.1